MVIRLESAAIKCFDPNKAIHHWNAQSTSVRRPFFKAGRKPQHQVTVLDVSAWAAKSEQAEGEINVASTPAAPAQLEEAQKGKKEEKSQNKKMKKKKQRGERMVLMVMMVGWTQQGH